MKRFQLILPALSLLIPWPLARGQEGPPLEITIDTEPTGLAAEWLPLLVGACVIVAGWGLLVRALEKNRSRVRWDRLKWVAPTSMLASGLIGQAVASRIVWAEPLMILWTIFNLPALLPLAPLIGILGLLEWQLPDWVLFAIGAGLFWLSWHGIIQFLDWRAWRDIPISLDLK